MIVLSRRKQESVVVGGSSVFGRVLKVTVLEIGDGHVKLGFEANEDIPVRRSEGWKRLFAGMPPAVPQANDEGTVAEPKNGSRSSQVEPRRRAGTGPADL